jgi:hypothetical protein
MLDDFQRFGSFFAFGLPVIQRVGPGEGKIGGKKQ